MTALFGQEAATRQDGPTRTQLIDFLALSVALLPALVFVSIAIRTGWPPTPSLLGLGSPLLLAFLALWWQGVRLLSNLEIRDASRRALFLGVLFPIMLGAAPLAVVFLLGSISRLTSPDAQLAIWLSVALAVAAIGGLLGLGIRYVQSGAKPLPKPLTTKSDG